MQSISHINVLCFLRFNIQTIKVYMCEEILRNKK